MSRIILDLTDEERKAIDALFSHVECDLCNKAIKILKREFMKDNINIINAINNIYNKWKSGAIWYYSIPLEIDGIKLGIRMSRNQLLRIKKEKSGLFRFPCELRDQDET